MTSGLEAGPCEVKQVGEPSYKGGGKLQRAPGHRVVLHGVRRWRPSCTVPGAFQASWVAVRSSPLLVLALVALAADASALPDLTPEIDDVRIETNQTVSAGDVAEGCAAARQGRTLVRFGVRFWNRGTEPMRVGAPGCPDCEANPGAVCQDPRFICSPADGHNHPHYDDFAHYELLAPDGTVVARGYKASFCIRETACATGPASGLYSCEAQQGIGVDCFDYYDASLGCQYIDVTDVPDATRRAFRIRVTIDPDGELSDADRRNNVAELAIAGCGDGVVDDGEDCDGGACCGADCRFLPAGTVCRASAGVCDAEDACTGDAAECPGDAVAPAGTQCRPAAGPCDAPEACDGASTACPADVPAPDGVQCGPGMSPCIAEVCRAGTCTAELDPGFCRIDAACVAAGTVDAGGCRVCNPARNAGGWTDLSGPDAPGLRCQLDRVAAAVATSGCRPAASRRIGRVLARVDAALDRVLSRARATDRRKLARRVRSLARLARRRGCGVEEATTLRSQAESFLALGGGRTPVGGGP